MKIYLASRYARRSELNGYAGILENLGHVITSNWLMGHHVILEDLPQKERIEKSAKFAQEDLDGIENCELFVLFTDEPEKVWKAGGMFVELGYALALKKKVVIVGKEENVFCYLPKIKIFSSWNNFLTHLF